MLNKLRNIWDAEKIYFGAVAKQLSIPALIAALYGAYDWHSSKGANSFSLSAYLKVTMPALFFIMWFVGMYERARKKTNDKESFDNLSSGLQSLTDLVKGLQNSPHATKASPIQSAASSAYSSTLINESIAIFAAGHKLAALLQAGVAFEQAVRAFARRQGVESTEQIPLLRILQKIDFLLPGGWQGEFHMLRQIRNQLAHASEQELDRIEHPEVVLNTYALAIEALNDPSNDRKVVPR